MLVGRIINQLFNPWHFQNRHKSIVKNLYYLDLSKQLAKLESENLKMKEKNKKLLSDYNTLKEQQFAKPDDSSLQEQLATLTNQNKQLSEKVKCLSAEKEDLAVKTNELTTENDRLFSENEVLTAENEQLTADKEELEEAKESCAAEMAAKLRKEAEENSSRLTEEISRLQSKFKVGVDFIIKLIQ